MKFEQALGEAEREKLQKVNKSVALVVGVMAIMLFWFGINFLKDNVFPNYYNPSRHMIVSQDQDSGIVYSWKDALGNVYTRDDKDVKYFPYGIMALILIEMALCIGTYSILTEHFALAILVKSKYPEQSQTVPEEKSPMHGAA